MGNINVSGAYTSGSTNIVSPSLFGVTEAPGIILSDGIEVQAVPLPPGTRVIIPCLSGAKFFWAEMKNQD